jgi:phenylacetate-coenzyme A ligase PaaK-like adenylate-forming protein
MKCVIAGKWNDMEIQEALRMTQGAIDAAVSQPPLRQEKVIEALDALGKRVAEDRDFLMPQLQEYGLTPAQAMEEKKGARSVLNAGDLRLKCSRELSSPCGEIVRVSTREDAFEGNMPLGVLCHVTSGNDAMLPFFSAVEGLLTGNVNLIKPAGGTVGIVGTLCAEISDMYPFLAPYLYVLPISSRDEEHMKNLFDLSDAVAVWGSNKATEGVRKLVSPGTRVIEWGHRISFAYVAEGGENEKALEGVCRDVCMNDQLACSAPQIVYFETDSREKLTAFAERLYHVMERISPQYEAHPVPDDSRAEITSVSLLEKMRSLMDDGSVLAAPDDSFRIFVGFKETFEASPLYRSILVRPIVRKEVLSVLRPYRANLQTCSLICRLDELSELSSLLYAAGVTRLVDAGQMGEGYSGEPHDGVYAMSRYVRRVEMRRHDFPWGMMSMNELKPQGEAPFPAGTPILKKQDFAEMETAAGTEEGHLVLKSGGSSGKSVYAIHSYEDADNTYRTAAQSFFAAGIDPSRDIVMNLFYAGNLYGGFISIYEAIKYLGVTQLPMCASMDFDEVVKEIAANRVNVLCGMSSYLMRLLTEKQEALRDYGGIEKVYYAGEHFDPERAETLKKDLGIREIRSLTYGCNEIGTMGYACRECTGGIHHLVTDTKYMEILKLDRDEPVGPGETGRIVVSSKDESLKIYRYELGDLGRWVEGDCPCGRKTPRFELLGRFGDVFKFATNYISIKAIGKVLSEQLSYHGPLQAVLEMDGKERMTVCVDQTLSENAVLQALQEGCPEIAETLRDDSGIVEVRAQDAGKFICSENGGKIRPVVDRRPI